MVLPNDLISKFVKITRDDKKTKNETTVYGTVVESVVESDGLKYARVRLDGADENQLTPAITTVDTEKGNRVSVLIKDHTATVTGNISSPAARVETVDLVTQTVEAQNGKISNIEADNVEINKTLTAHKASMEKIEADNVEINETLTAQKASIDELETNKLSAEDAKLLYANIDFANIGEAAIEKLFSDSGIIGDLVMSDGHVTGKLVGVTIVGDLIEGGTVKAEKLVIRGTDGLFYKLNTNGATVSSEQTEYNSLSGTLITAKSVTAEKINVDDLVAFGATIGGFHITEDSIYSGAKASVDNTTRGIYQDTDGQFAIGDANNFLKFYKDTDGTYKLAISASTIMFGDSGKSVEKAITEVQNGVTNVETNLEGFKSTVSSTYATKTISDTRDDNHSPSWYLSNYPRQVVTEFKHSYVVGLPYRIIASGTGEVVSPAYVEITIADGISLKSGKTYTFRGTAITELTKYRAWVSLYTEDHKRLTMFILGSEETSTDAVIYTADADYDNATLLIQADVTSGLSIAASLETALERDDPGITTANIHCTLTTTVPWIDASGGYPKQVAKIEGKEFWRVGISNYVWGPWSDPLGIASDALTRVALTKTELQNDISEASKTAKNFLEYDSSNGLQIGNKTGGSWSGFRAQITAGAYNILNAAGTVLASYGEKLIELGKNATDAIIKLCGGKGQIEYVTDEDSGTDYIQISSDRVRIKSSKMSSVYSMYTDNSTRWEKSAVNVSPTKVELYASECIEPTLSEHLEGWHITRVDIESGRVDVETPGPVTFNSEGVYDNYGKLMSVERGSSGIWSYSKWSNGRVELEGVYNVSNLACTTALGTWYRTAVFQPNNFPFTVYNPKLTANYESEGYGAMLWATTTTITSKPPSYYLIRPTSATIASGKIIFHVTGTWS